VIHGHLDSEFSKSLASGEPEEGLRSSPYSPKSQDGEQGIMGDQVRFSFFVNNLFLESNFYRR